MSELKPCPFCGGEAIMHEGEFSSKTTEYKKEIPKGARIIRSTTYPSGKTWHEYRVKAFVPRCMDTKCLGRVYRLFETEAEAIEAWNRRANDDVVGENPDDDVVEVVSCKDCRNSRPLRRNDPVENQYVAGCVWCMEHSVGMREDDFCSYGERRDNDGNEENL